MASSLSKEWTIQRLHGEQASDFLDEIAALRIEVFRDFPYLYEGSREYEENYLGRYIACPESLFVLVFDGEKQLVGCSTGMPLDREMDVIQKPFHDSGRPVDEFFYFGESLLKKEWRGQRIGHRFFDEREAFARALARFRYTTFCSVERPADHPLQPKDYSSLDSFWRKRGYVRQPLRTTLSWPDIGDTRETGKTMIFWIKPLG